MDDYMLNIVTTCSLFCIIGLLFFLALVVSSYYCINLILKKYQRKNRKNGVADIEASPQPPLQSQSHSIAETAGSLLRTEEQQQQTTRDKRVSGEAATTIITSMSETTTMKKTQMQTEEAAAAATTTTPTELLEANSIKRIKKPTATFQGSYQVGCRSPRLFRPGQYEQFLSTRRTEQKQQQQQQQQQGEQEQARDEQHEQHENDSTMQQRHVRFVEGVSMGANRSRLNATSSTPTDELMPLPMIDDGVEVEEATIDHIDHRQSQSA